MVKRILLPTDSSLPALVATMEAVKLAKERQATLIALTVVELTPSTELEQHAGNVGLKRCPDIDGMKFVRVLAQQEGVEIEEIVREGPVSGEIVRVANDFKVETIVMGSSKPHGLTELYLGDVARSVAKHSAGFELITINPTPEQNKTTLELARRLAKKEVVKTVKSITSSKQFKVGLGLFAAYSIFYAVFVIFGSYERDLMGERFLGLNLGLVMGLLVIVIAIVMAIWFNWYAAKKESEQEA